MLILTLYITAAYVPWLKPKQLTLADGCHSDLGLLRHTNFGCSHILGICASMMKKQPGYSLPNYLNTASTKGDFHSNPITHLVPPTVVEMLGSNTARQGSPCHMWSNFFPKASWKTKAASLTRAREEGVCSFQFHSTNHNVFVCPLLCFFFSISGSPINVHRAKASLQSCVS